MKALVCFAVPDEARHFRPPADCTVLITGMGQGPARVAGQNALAQHSPAFVFTCGFAGGLNPSFPPGTVIFETADSRIAARLKDLRALPARFHCSSRVAITRAEKKLLWDQTQADVVEMESGILRQLCQERGIPAATVRVISDSADEDLPMDFNLLISPEGKLKMSGLIARVLRNPDCIPGLLRLQKRSAHAARTLGRCLEELLRADR